MNNKAKIAISTLALLLTACGSSDSDDSTDPAGITLPTIDTTEVTIVNANTESVSGVALQSSFNNIALGTTEGFTGVVVEQSTDSLHITDATWVMSQLEKLPKVNDTFTGIVSTETESCSISGDIEFTFNVKDVAGISVNDSISYTANNCNDGFGVSNGTFTMTFTQFKDFVDYDDYTTFGIDVSFNAYSIGFDSESAVISGAYSLVMNKDLYTQVADISSDQLTIEVSTYQTSVEDLIVQEVLTENTGVKTFVTSSKVSDDLIGGSVTVSTVEEFVYSSKYSDEPTSGSMLISGANGSSVLLTVIVGAVQLEADYDGDKVIDNTITTTWSSLSY